MLPSTVLQIVSMQHEFDSNLNWRLENSHPTFSNWNRCNWICFGIFFLTLELQLITKAKSVSNLKLKFLLFFFVPFISQSKQFIMGRKPKQNYASKCFKFWREALSVGGRRKRTEACANDELIIIFNINRCKEVLNEFSMLTNFWRLWGLSSEERAVLMLWICLALENFYWLLDLVQFY